MRILGIVLVDLLTLSIAVPVIVQGLPYNETVVSGQQLKFTCIGESVPTPHVEWLKDNRKLNNADVQTSGNFKKTFNLTISDVRYKDHGEYTCAFSNYRGHVSSTVRLIVHGRSIAIS